MRADELLPTLPPWHRFTVAKTGVDKRRRLPGRLTIFSQKAGPKSLRRIGVVIGERKSYLMRGAGNSGDVAVAQSVG